jgi:hypothetical protein
MQIRVSHGDFVARVQVRFMRPRCSTPHHAGLCTRHLLLIDTLLSPTCPSAKERMMLVPLRPIIYGMQRRVSADCGCMSLENRLGGCRPVGDRWHISKTQKHIQAKLGKSNQEKNVFSVLVNSLLTLLTAIALMLTSTQPKGSARIRHSASRVGTSPLLSKIT